MSSKYVRDQIEAFVAANLPSEVYVDVTGEFEYLESLLKSKGVSLGDNWLGCQFVGSDESPIAVGNKDYREYGAVFFHIVAEAKAGARMGIIDRAETLRDAFRGKRIGNIVIESVAPPNFEAAATLQFEGGWTSAGVTISFYNELHF